MIFTQPIFLLFFLVTIVLYWRMESNRARKAWLFTASYFFYGYWDFRFLGLILFCTSVDYFAALALEKSSDGLRRKQLITLSVVVNLTVLGFFKYFNFFVDSAYALLHELGVSAEPPGLRILLPVGISFFTFQSMSYTIDVYRGEIRARRNFLDFALFVSFFPQLVAGPIVRARDFLPQLEQTRSLAHVDLRRMLVLFAVGYFKKACVADNIAAAIDPVFADPTIYDAAARLVGAALYSLQIFCDFSGYSDMAIAVAGLFGYTLTRNFDAPYLSPNIQQFWSRWHISLSTWLRDYLYIPLGGNRGPAWFVARNLFLTMLIGGLWHGANWTFVVWGALHGVALILHRYVLIRLPSSNAVTRGLGWLLTLFWVVLCFTVFRTDSIGTAWAYFTVPAISDALTLSPAWWLILLSLGFMQFRVRERLQALDDRVDALADPVFYMGLGVACSVLLYLTPASMSPFIYFQF